MASVRMSGQLRTDILSEIDSKFKIADPKPTAKSGLAQVVLDALREHPAYKAASEFLQNPAIVTIYNSNRASTLKSYIDNFRRTEVVKKIHISGFRYDGMPRPFETELPLPASMHFGATYHGSMEVHLDDFAPAQRQELEAAMIQSTKDLLDWETRYASYTKAAKTLLENCNTVGQFLDAWPGAESLLKQEIVQKLHDKSKSTRDLDAAAVRAAFDAEAASPTLLVANIVGAATNGT